MSDKYLFYTVSKHLPFNAIPYETLRNIPSGHFGISRGKSHGVPVGSPGGSREGAIESHLTSREIPWGGMGSYGARIWVSPPNINCVPLPIPGIFAVNMSQGYFRMFAGGAFCSDRDQVFLVKILEHIRINSCFCVCDGP